MIELSAQDVLALDSAAWYLERVAERTNDADYSAAAEDVRDVMAKFAPEPPIPCV